MQRQLFVSTTVLCRDPGSTRLRRSGLLLNPSYVIPASMATLGPDIMYRIVRSGDCVHTEPLAPAAGNRAWQAGTDQLFSEDADFEQYTGGKFPIPLFDVQGV
jgi:hypothetical protein